MLNFKFNVFIEYTKQKIILNTHFCVVNSMECKHYTVSRGVARGQTP